MANASNFDVKKKKRALIVERIDSDSVAHLGMLVSRSALLILLFLRLGLFLFEIIFTSVSGLTLDAVSSLLLVPMLLIFYMIYDGNKGLAGILMISAVVRGVLLFTSLLPTFPEGALTNVFVGIYLAIMGLQFAGILLITAYAPCVSYFTKMQEINMAVAALLRAPASAQRSNSPTQRSNTKKKKK